MKLKLENAPFDKATRIKAYQQIHETIEESDDDEFVCIEILEIFGYYSYPTLKEKIFKVLPEILEVKEFSHNIQINGNIWFDQDGIGESKRHRLAFLEEVIEYTTNLKEA